MDANDAETAYYVDEADKATTSLRAALIEAGAQGLDGRPVDDLEGAASAVLDAFLDVLADRADEWVLQSWDYYTAERHEWVPRLLAVLRDDIEPEEDS